ncbi:MULTISPECIES: 1-deoxy-D-xylulose-5-phosphate reductoisomerase [Erysipelotrichaceae]|jgi:1-deoxy-D-xylulose-5-phosphate reductoisomerase|uniref:1-deoxy-D-xylulose 5-phosphate reductoisomerase n=2 Tax=Amedibacillus TaxID=2749846 RepID=A0A7G9GLP3_9FIRM|nr:MULTISPECIES: 1-deoxy-D-xylulose-5-phosphate reductoisomerase [Erysipelotrichaceae]QNM11725.1 1-deoxy-D-xylulose-5-phosphate reductoisomerase [[Eubacterium] hominis]MCH4285025.1 1-deoxy-D-xylulose-5-phosphate reductoisomerase [Amedibacillus hominis]RGB56058.1 1-deoxy-D-xylulose-5-phosphate reductoisomerase [Absiella sp. AM22-9]RGB61819.1 1-deoxy-D-xylulose-5-phosphate reductoisomerase [Absiella sp. AM10-20]RGB70360.1 1-deoxy-D-xylulose-5-phosphate reductoisomerase [Absiella sp. AM09-45]
MKKIVLLGATGSIGTQTIDVVNHHRNEFSIIGLSAGHNMKKLSELLEVCPDVKYVCVARKADMEEMQKMYPSLTFFCEDKGLEELASLSDYDIFVNAIVGFRGLLPTLSAIKNQKVIALANKESLVAGGPLVKAALKKYNVPLYPIDSEHSAIFQCLQGSHADEVDKLIITASGGSFRDKTREELKDVTVAQALKHPNWNMGGRITIDSATMMNKGFEVIEAHYLFDVPYDDIDVLVHRESVIHSMVQFHDHAIIAQLGTADMRLPIQYALSYPDRLEMHNAEKFDFMKYPALHFEAANTKRYPLLGLAFEVGRKGGNLGAVMNGADEEAVALFLQEKISFLDIETYVIRAVEAAVYIEHPTLQDLIDADHFGRAFVKDTWKGVVE